MNNDQTATATRSRAQATATRLTFPHGVANLTIRVDASMPNRYRGEFYGPKPQLTETDGVVCIDYPRFNPLIWGRTSATMTISPSVTWCIEISGGVSRWDADLREIDLTAIDVQGGASKVDLRLPRPDGAVPVRVSGGVSQVTLRRPAGVPARVHIGGGASQLELDTQYLGAIGGPVRLETPDYARGAGKYDLEIGGGASKVTIKAD
jgi:hypothetical protein